ncbi:hypothetical protein A8709_26600 [Paenibacillus pectinilyticus]|uniref:Uncharacterized protein n=1 Tax=Paenibacillus pectinilyticus TaxID=512399 RepID=A0A1C1A1I1_9BACL|nr:hypothetical protein A8709_26600 [Paenibacillus pectinilyticus]
MISKEFLHRCRNGGDQYDDLRCKQNSKRGAFAKLDIKMGESAHMDGAYSSEIITNMIIPLSRPVLFVVGLFAFRKNWNSLLWPLVATNRISRRTITAGLTVAQRTFENEFTLVNTITVMSAIILLIIFIFVQKYFTEGLSISSALKE